MSEITKRAKWALLACGPLVLIAGGVMAESNAGVLSPRLPWIAPSRYAKKTNPIQADATSIETGAKVYEAQCLACHGKTGAGDGIRAGELDPRPNDLSKPEVWLQTDGELFYKVFKGRTPMPTFDKLLTADEIWHVITYIRTLAPEPAVLGSRFDIGAARRTSIGAVVAAATRYHDAAVHADAKAMAAAAQEAAQAADALNSINLTDQDKAIADLWKSSASSLASRATALASASADASDALDHFTDALALVLRSFGGVDSGLVYQFILPTAGAAGDALAWFQTDSAPRAPFQQGDSSGKPPVVYVFGPSTSTK